MPGPQRQAYKESLQAAIQADPDIAMGRKIAFVATTAFLGTRLLLFVMELVLSTTYGAPFPFMQLAVTVISVLFAVMMYGGARVFAGLALLGGFWSLWQNWEELRILLSIFHIADTVLVVYTVVFILAILTTIAGMAFLLLSAKYRKYADAAKELQQQAVRG